MVIYFSNFIFFFFLFLSTGDKIRRREKNSKGRTPRSVIRQIDREGGKENRRVAANAANLGFIFGFFGGFNSPSRSTASPQWRSPRLKRQLKTRTGMKIIERVEWQWLPRLKEQYPSVAGKQVDGGLGQRIELEKIEGMCTCTQRVHRAQCVFRTIPKALVVSGF